MLKEIEEKRKEGRPTKYKKEYCDEIITFFDRELYHKELIEVKVKGGGTKEEFREVPNDIAFFSEFARKIGVTTSSLDRWVHKYPEFRDAYKKAQQIQKEFLIKNGLAGRYNPTFAIFTAKNITDMRDKQEVDHNVEWVIMNYADKPKK
jgi:hypothetical protein